MLPQGQAIAAAEVLVRMQGLSCSRHNDARNQERPSSGPQVSWGDGEPIGEPMDIDSYSPPRPASPVAGPSDPPFVVPHDSLSTTPPGSPPRYIPGSPPPPYTSRPTSPRSPGDDDDDDEGRDICVCRFCLCDDCRRYRVVSYRDRAYDEYDDEGSYDSDRSYDDDHDDDYDDGDDDHNHQYPDDYDRDYDGYHKSGSERYCHRCRRYRDLIHNDESDSEDDQSDTDSNYSLCLCGDCLCGTCDCDDCTAYREDAPRHEEIDTEDDIF
ncbi:hypothetical protein F5Y14DRAFT_452587 [Nemania sp. NC0429]|nr:hypothetical protein F5Y14DRAFT_452587 [Nemania sp. NC0429]